MDSHPSEHSVAAAGSSAAASPLPVPTSTAITSRLHDRPELGIPEFLHRIWMNCSVFFYLFRPLGKAGN